MDLSKIKLTKMQMVRPFLSTIKRSGFVLALILLGLFISSNVYVATAFPVILANNPILDAILSFTLAFLFHVASAIPIILLIAWITESDDELGGERLYRSFKSQLNDNMIKAKHQVWETVVEDELLKR